MAPLLGRMIPDEKKQVTRTAHREITAVLETWEAKVSLTLFADGEFVVEVGEKYGAGEVGYRGNANQGGR